MNKIIWTCWFQGRETAPPLVKSCLKSWERNNPGWEFRCLDAASIERYLPLRQYVDLDHQTLTCASLSDIVRILLLREFGGVWVDATLFCNRPLDEWLSGVMDEGFFAFAAPAPDRPLSSWFLSGESNNYLVSTWCRRTIEYWSNRADTDDYFWFHHLFREMCETHPRAAEAWSRVPKISAEGPHALQIGGRMHRSATEVLDEIDRSTPVFKLTHRLPEESVKPGSMLEHLLEHGKDEHGAYESASATLDGATPRSSASLKVSTENLGDHIQIISGLRLLSRSGVKPERYIDRDNEIKSAPGLEEEDGPVGILLNGWFKTNHRAEWPPHPKLAPLIPGFHIRLFQCPELISDASLEFFRRYQPIGCRDVYTETLLRSNGVEAFTSNCLSLTLCSRLEDPMTQTEVFVVSRDERVRDYLPKSIGPYTFVSHYSGSSDFAANMAQAEQLLETYRSRAKLIVTTLLHCAQPAIAMGIPVVVFYPINNETGHASDRERFSALQGLVRVYRFDEIESVNWSPESIDVGELKLRILDRFYEMVARWRIALPSPIGPIVPSNVPANASAKRTGIYLAILQLVFTLGWTTYVIYLPRLAAEVGIAPSAVILILMLDQAIFTVTDTAMGIAADKIAPVVGRLGVFVGALTALSCAAFVALPFVAGAGPGAQIWFIALIVIWSITSSALRAPPLTLLGKHRAKPSVPFLSALAMLGYGVAGAVSPYLGVIMRNQDPRLPFVMSSVVLLITALALSRVERGLGRDTPSPDTPAEAKPLGRLPIIFIASMVVLALGYQLHFSINSAPFFLRFTKPDELQWLMPVFWIGFNIAMFPASVVTKRRGGLIVMGAAGLLGALAVLGAELAGNLNTLIATQFIAGAAWGCMLMSAISAALAIGERGAEGKVVGLVFSALALATFARMAAVAGGLQKLPEYAPLLHWAPVACWSVAGAGLLVIAASRAQAGMQLRRV